jgi:hypothetical protein
VGLGIQLETLVHVAVEVDGQVGHDAHRPREIQEPILDSPVFGVPRIGEGPQRHSPRQGERPVHPGRQYGRTVDLDGRSLQALAGQGLFDARLQGRAVGVGGREGEAGLLRRQKAGPKGYEGGAASRHEIQGAGFQVPGRALLQPLASPGFEEGGHGVHRVEGGGRGVEEIAETFG